jgi:hypothetical protein
MTSAAQLDVLLIPVIDWFRDAADREFFGAQQH